MPSHTLLKGSTDPFLEGCGFLPIASKVLAMTLTSSYPMSS